MSGLNSESPDKETLIIKWILPEGDEVGVTEDRAEEGEQELPHLRVPLHVTPPDLGQQRLKEERKLDHFHQLQFMHSV